MTGEAEDERAASELLGIFGLVDRWSARVPANTAVQPGSRTASDDAAAAPFQLSHFCELTLSSAVDHLAGLRTAIQDGGALHMAAPFTLMRAALENAASAVWVLSPPNQEDRVLRRLRFAVDDARDTIAVMELTGDPVVPSASHRRERIAAIAAAAGLSRDAVLGRGASWSTVVREAGLHTALPTPSTEVVWRLCSGFTHGRPWAWLAALAPSTIGENEDVQVLNMTAPLPTVLLAAQAAAEMITTGYEMHDRHRLAWRAHRARSGD